MHAVHVENVGFLHTSACVMGIEKFFARRNKSVVEVGAEVTGGGGPSCIKIGYSRRDPRRVLRPCNKVGYSSAMY